MQAIHQCAYSMGPVERPLLSCNTFLAYTKSQVQSLTPHNMSVVIHFSDPSTPEVQERQSEVKVILSYVVGSRLTWDDEILFKKQNKNKTQVILDIV